jgi:hypothetical protein
MKVTYEDLRAIELNTTKPFAGTPRELHNAKALAGQLALLHPEENRSYQTKTDNKKGFIYITAIKK